MNVKKIGIVVADFDEYKPFVEAVAEYSPKAFDLIGRKAVSFNIANTEIICILCGIGKVNAAAAAMYLAAEKCDCILNYGLSGGISGVKKGCVVIPERFLEHDFDLTGIGYKPCEKPSQKYIYDADKNLRNIFLSVFENAVGGTAVCGDRFICSESDRVFLKDTFSATSCDMETAAIASVCDMTDTPYVALRRISDDAGDDAADSYRDMNVNEGSTLAQLFLSVLKVICQEDNNA